MHFFVLPILMFIDIVYGMEKICLHVHLHIDNLALSYMYQYGHQSSMREHTCVPVFLCEFMITLDTKYVIVSAHGGTSRISLIFSQTKFSFEFRTSKGLTGHLYCRSYQQPLCCQYHLQIKKSSIKDGCLCDEGIFLIF